MAHPILVIYPQAGCTRLFIVIPDESCLAAYLAAAEPYTYLHCMGNGDNLLGDTVFTEMDYPLGPPSGKAEEVREGIYVRKFGGGTKPTIVTWNNNMKTGTIEWAHLSGM